MAQITVRNVSQGLHAALKREAERRGSSVNRLVLSLLRQGLGLQSADDGPRPHHDLDHLVGAWSSAEASQFLDALSEQRQVEAELWR
ncbi:MAG: FitA-like ribbon-helix-helix domain-containing protein [Candidatus Promineifilaceae bacterium]